MKSQSANSKGLRLFVAIVPPKSVLDRLAVFVDEAGGSIVNAGIRWSKPESLHLTLAFLGNVQADRIEELKAAFRGCAASASPIRLELESVCCFPSLRSPKVVWAGVTGELNGLESLAAVLRNRLEPFGSHRETKGFAAHLTLARVCRPSKQDVTQIARLVELAQGKSFGTWTFGSVRLVQSRPGKGGSDYTALDEASLASA